MFEEAYIAGFEKAALDWRTGASAYVKAVKKYKEHGKALEALTSALDKAKGLSEQKFYINAAKERAGKAEKAMRQLETFQKYWKDKRTADKKRLQALLDSEKDPFKRIEILDEQHKSLQDNLEFINKAAPLWE